MAYLNTNDLKALLEDVEYLTDQGDYTANEAILAAEGWVDGWLDAVGVDTPLSADPGQPIKSAAANYACYVLLRRKNRTGELTEAMTEFRTEAYRLRDDYRAGVIDAPGKALPKREGTMPVMVNPHAAEGS